MEFNECGTSTLRSKCTNRVSAMKDAHALVEIITECAEGKMFNKCMNGCF